MKILLFAVLLGVSGYLSGQKNYLSPFDDNKGICIGNSSDFIGLRLNLWDRNADSIKGVTISGLAAGNQVKGISVGVIGSENLNSTGLQIGGLYTSSGVNKGIVISGLGIQGVTFKGIGLSGITLQADTLNGIFIAFFEVVPGDRSVPENSIRGLAAGGSVIAGSLSGLSIGCLVNKIDHLTGVSIAGVNMTNELHGFQFGLINCAMNNRKPFRWLPLINFNLRGRPEK